MSRVVSNIKVVPSPPQSPRTPGNPNAILASRSAPREASGHWYLIPGPVSDVHRGPCRGCYDPD